MFIMHVHNDLTRRGLGLSVRYFSRSAVKSSNPTTKYRKTLNLPKSVSSFPLSMKGGVSAKRELNIQQTCNFDELYKWQRGQERKKEFVLHDGPPYANGNPHVGHALNKILKDITNRYKLLRGYKIHYVPGWDCHGLPIELKALQNLRTTHTDMDPLDIRKIAQAFAQKTINVQRAAFKRWGVMADWSNECYYTFDKKYETRQLDAFYSMYEKGFVYQDYMPVYWSPSSRTALAEAELEYNQLHESTAVYVRCSVSNLPSVVQQKLGGGSDQCWAVVWTTTPWTLPANRAICYAPGIEYCVLKDRSKSQSYLISSEFKDKLQELLGGAELETIFTGKGTDLAGARYVHPLYPDREMPLLPGDHVTTGKGTGLVHTAPAHGPEDFQVAVKHGLGVECHVDEDGRYTSEVGLGLVGKDVTQDADSEVLSLLGDHVVHSEAFVHSYPYDWRTKKPVILRASLQWFVNTSQVAPAATACLRDVVVVPRSSAQGMVAQLERRTYWCISRQRVWGVPIPIFYHPDGTPLITRQTVDHLKSLVLKHGTDCWWTLPLEQLLPPSVIERSGMDPSVTYRRGNDVLDIWFDSGTSWAAVLEGKMADVYLEGLDQFGGWFQSSLLTSVAARGQAPYKALVVHGFAVDDDGKKMSKSIGNVVDPQVIINGGKDREAEPAYGVDVLRWWAAQSGLQTNVNIGPATIQNCHVQIFRIRKVLRYLLGNLHDFQPEEHSMVYEHLFPQDQYLLHRLHQFCKQVTDSYEEYNYMRAVQLIEKFVSIQVSGYHCHITKDRLYCSSADSPYRRSGQTVQHATLQIVLKALAPILPHMAEEAHLSMYSLYSTDCDSIFKRRWFEADPKWHNPDLAATFDIVLNMKATFNAAITADNPVQFDVVVYAKPLLFEKIKILQDEETSSTSALAEVMQCSHTSLLAKPPLVIPDESQTVEGTCSITMPGGGVEDHKYLLVLLPPEKSLCDRCRRQTAPHRQALCDRCSDVLADGWDM